MGSRKGISPRNSPPPQVSKIVKNKESTDFTISKIFVIVAILFIVLAVGAQYVYVNYYYRPNRISTKSELPTVSTKPDPVCSSSKFQILNSCKSLFLL